MTRVLIKQDSPKFVEVDTVAIFINSSKKHRRPSACCRHRDLALHRKLPRSYFAANYSNRDYSTQSPLYTMKTTAALSLLALGSASAFAPAAQKAGVSTRLSAAAEYEGMPGISTETGGKFFDPLDISGYAPADWMRKAELSNGRSAMLANVGWFWPKIAGTFDSDDVTTTDPIEAILQADAQWWAQFFLLCGVIEGIKYRSELEGKSFTGDGPAAIDYSKQWNNLDAQKKEDMRLSELKNGRLAMLGFASYVADYFIPGSVPPLSLFH